MEGRCRALSVSTSVGVTPGAVGWTASQGAWATACRLGDMEADGFMVCGIPAKA